MFGLAEPKAKLAGMETHDYLADVVFRITRERTDSLAELTFDEANACIKDLGGVPFQLFARSKRTENYRKQQAGIKTIETDAHLKLIEELSGALGWDADRLRGFCQRQIKKDSPTTTEEGNKVVEPLKAMCSRAGIIVFPKSAKSTASTTSEPKFRRVA